MRKKGRDSVRDVDHSNRVPLQGRSGELLGGFQSVISPRISSISVLGARSVDASLLNYEEAS